MDTYDENNIGGWSLTKEEVTIEELEKHVRKLRESYQSFGVITIATVLLILIRLT